MWCRLLVVFLSISHSLRCILWELNSPNLLFSLPPKFKLSFKYSVPSAPILLIPPSFVLVLTFFCFYAIYMCAKFPETPVNLKKRFSIMYSYERKKMLGTYSHILEYMEGHVSICALIAIVHGFTTSTPPPTRSFALSISQNKCYKKCSSLRLLSLKYLPSFDM